MAAISDAERVRIEEKAREILKEFSAALEKVKVKERKQQGETESGWREEGQGMQGDAAFRTAMLANAPEHDEDAVITEKKKW